MTEAHIEILERVKQLRNDLHTYECVVGATIRFIVRETTYLAERYEGRSIADMSSYEHLRYELDRERYDELKRLTSVIAGASLDEITIDVPEFPELSH